MREVKQVYFQKCISLQAIPFCLVNFDYALDALHGAEWPLFPDVFYL